MNNKEKIEAINKWQKCKFVHPLTCGVDKCDGILEPKKKKLKLNVDKQICDEEYTVYLKCPNCDYIQYNIPDVVYRINYAKFNQIEDFISRKNK